MTQTPNERSLVRDVGLLVVGALIAFAVNEYGASLLRSLRSTPASVSAQLAAIERHATSIGLYPVIRRAHLHGDGTESLIVESIFAYKLPGDDASNPRSDSLAIYDLRPDNGGTTLERRFSFSPAGVSGGVDTPSWRLREVAIEDVADDGRQEIVGGWSEDRADDSDVRPFMVSWNPVKHRYVIAPLLTRPVPLPEPSELSERDREARHLYATAAMLRDRAAGISITAFGTERFAVQAASVVPDRRFVPASLVVVEEAETNRDLRAAVRRHRFRVDVASYRLDARSTPVLSSYCGSAATTTSPFVEPDTAAILKLYNTLPIEDYEPGC